MGGHWKTLTGFKLWPQHHSVSQERLVEALSHKNHVERFLFSGPMSHHSGRRHNSQNSIQFRNGEWLCSLLCSTLSFRCASTLPRCLYENDYQCVSVPASQSARSCKWTADKSRTRSREPLQTCCKRWWRTVMRILHHANLSHCQIHLRSLLDHAPWNEYFLDRFR